MPGAEAVLFNPIILFMKTVAAFLFRVRNRDVVEFIFTSFAVPPPPKLPADVEVTASV